MSVVIGIDLGTSLFKVGVFSASGELRGLSRTPVVTDGGANTGGCELPVERFRSLIREGIGSAISQAGVTSGEIEGVSYSSQANSFLLLDANFRPITPIVLWPDRRASTVFPAFRELGSREDFSGTTGFDSPDVLYCLNKLLWFHHQEPELWERCRFIMTLSDYLAFLLTGERIGDTGTASLLGMWNLREGCWWEEALSALDIQRNMLSEQLRPGTVAGKLDGSVCEDLGLRQGIPFTVGSLDHHAAALGAGVDCIAPVSESTGTVLACFRSLPAFAPKRECAMGPGFVRGLPFYRLAYTEWGGNLLRRYREGWASHLTFRELDDLAAHVPAGCGGLRFDPSLSPDDLLDGFSGGEQPHEYGHYARAIMESISAILRCLVLDVCDGVSPEKIISTGGGAVSPLWLQMKADITGSTFLTTQYPEPAAAGAAMLAAHGAGWVESPGQAAAMWVRIRAEYEPDPCNRAVYSEQPGTLHLCCGNEG